MQDKQLNHNEKDPIDFVILWVDGADPEWLKKKEYYHDYYLKNVPEYAKIPGGHEEYRYNDFNTLLFLFRSIEKYAPWYNKIFLVTEGHVPDWLDISNPKLVLVKHEDIFEDKNNLPIFNSNAIQMQLHKIEELSEKFILLDDDMLIMRAVQPSNFYKNGLPLHVSKPAFLSRKKMSDNLFNIQCYNAAVLLKEKLKLPIINWHNYRKALFHGSPKRVSSTILKMMICHLGISSRVPSWLGFEHAPSAYLKSVHAEISRIFREDYTRFSAYRFRRADGIAIQWFWRQYYILKGIYHPRGVEEEAALLSAESHAADLAEIDKILQSAGKNYLCIQDCVQKVSESEFAQIKQEFGAVMAKHYPDKCPYEK